MPQTRRASQPHRASTEGAVSPGSRPPARAFAGVSVKKASDHTIDAASVAGAAPLLRRPRPGRSAAVTPGVSFRLGTMPCSGRRSEACAIGLRMGQSAIRRASAAARGSIFFWYLPRWAWRSASGRVRSRGSAPPPAREALTLRRRPLPLAPAKTLPPNPCCRCPRLWL